MPEMDGIELVQQARKINPEQKFVLISGGGTKFPNSEEYDYLTVSQTLTGVEHILRKPFDTRKVDQAG